MVNVFKAGKMASNTLDSLLANGKSRIDIIDGALVVLGNLDDVDLSGDYEYDTYEMAAPSASTDEVAIVDYAGRSEDEIAGNRYRIDDELYGLTIPAGILTRVRRLAKHDKFQLGDGNFSSTPKVGEYAIAEKGSFLHKPVASRPNSGYAIKILIEQNLTAGMRSIGKRYLCEVVSLGGGNGKDLANATPTQQVAYLVEELKGKHSLSDYLQANSDAIMKAAGIVKGQDGKSVLDTVYDILQPGGEIKATMADGAVLGLTGHFSDETGRWTLKTEIALPEKATGDMFPAGSGYSVKGGKVVVNMEPAEMTKFGEYGGCILVYGYSLDASGVTVSNGVREFTVDIAGLTRPDSTDSLDDYALIIDPNKENWTVTTREFQLPDEDAAGTIKIDDEAVKWKDVRHLLS